MSLNIDQVYIANPSTSLPGTALLYAGLSPFGLGNDTAITVANFLLQIPSSTIVNVSTSVQALSPNNVYITNDGAIEVIYTLPTTIAQGSTIEIVGMSSGGWMIAQNAGQSIHFGIDTTTVGVGGSISSTNQWDYVKLICVLANTVFSIIGGIGNPTVV